MPKRTVFHAKDTTAAKGACLQLNLKGWPARWSVDRSCAHVHVMHEPQVEEGIHDVVLLVDPAATACKCG